MAVVSTYTTTGPQNDASLDYNIELIFADTGDFSWGDTSESIFTVAEIEAIQAAFISAADTLSTIIIGDIADTTNAGAGIAADDLDVTITLSDIDGPFSSLGTWAASSVNSQFLAATGVIDVDLPDLDILITQGLLEDFALHTLLRTTGFGQLWSNLGLSINELPGGVPNINLPQPTFIGTNALYEWQILSGDNTATGVPLENGFTNGVPNGFGPGTTNTYWSEGALGNEIMTPGLGLDGSNFISNLTIAALEDMGYTTSYVATPCFLAGTAIETPDGARTVEDLAIGDRILTVDGQETEVFWVGRRQIESALAPGGWCRVVEIAPGALGHGLPKRALRVTSDHAMLLGGMLIEAGALVNGSDIRWRTPEGAFTVYHIETRGHQIIRAEGAATETYVDYVTRRAFDNFAEYAALYGPGEPIAELPLPRITRGDQARKPSAA